MKKPVRILIVIAAAAFAFGIAPLVVEWAVVPASRGYYSDGAGHCLCGHRNYYRVGDGVVTSHTFGHNYSVELYGLRKEGEATYALLDSDGRALGNLKLTPGLMIFDLPTLHSEQARVWSRWSIWWQIFRYRSEPQKTRTLKEFEERA
jgi:hypothetical protein